MYNNVQIIFVVTSGFYKFVAQRDFVNYTGIVQ